MQLMFQRFLEPLRQWRLWVPRYAIGGAWFFAIASAIPLLWLIVEGHGINGDSRIFGAVDANGVLHTVWGLSYAGAIGSILLWMELIVLIAATITAALPARFAKAGPAVLMRAQKLSHMYLTGWAGVWMLGTMHLASVAPGFWTLQAIFLATLFACTLYRAIREWPSQKTENESSSQSMETPNIAAPVEDAGPIRYRSAFNDIEEVSQYMLGREDVKFSTKVTQMFNRINAVEPSTDEYGSKIRAATRRAYCFARSVLGKAWMNLRTFAASLRSSPAHRA